MQGIDSLLKGTDNFQMIRLEWLLGEGGEAAFGVSGQWVSAALVGVWLLFCLSSL